VVFSRLSEPIRKALDKAGYTAPTQIQQEAIPPLLEGRDLFGIGQTGTGKTAAFLLPLLERLSQHRQDAIEGTPRALILAPTRELAAQIGESCTKYGRRTELRHTVIFGGIKQGSQVKALKHGVDILVATPGRLLDLMNQGYIFLDRLEIIVLDEADRMLDMGFLPDIKKILKELPEKRQSMFFSATLSKEVEQLAKSLVHEPIKVEVSPQSTTVELIMQKVFFVDSNKKDALLWLLLEREHLQKVLVFTRTKHRADKVARTLNKKGVKSVVIHGNRTQSQRTKALEQFHRGKADVLVATDIAARGIDVKDISHVINYDLPNEPENYVHRIGRTARAGKEGIAYSFCAAEDRDYLRDIEKKIKERIDVEEHDFHSNEARNASGAAARPPPRGQFRGQRPNKERRREKPAGRWKKTNEKPREFDREKPRFKRAVMENHDSNGENQKNKPPRNRSVEENRHLRAEKRNQEKVVKLEENHDSAEEKQNQGNHAQKRTAEENHDSTAEKQRSKRRQNHSNEDSQDHRPTNEQENHAPSQKGADVGLCRTFPTSLPRTTRYASEPGQLRLALP
jgi:ATP-dependent RNA helicase RhlE